MNSPFKPPRAPVRDISVEKGSAFKAVIVGLIVDIVGSTIAGIVLTVIYAITLAGSGATADDIVSSLTDIPHDSWVFIAANLVGCAFSALGGYLCARIAKHSEYRLGAILAAISATLGFLLAAGQLSPALNVATAIATLASIMAGVWWGVKKNGLAERAYAP